MSKPINVNINADPDRVNAYIAKNPHKLNADIQSLNGGNVFWGEIDGNIENQSDLIEYVAQNNDYEKLQNKPSIEHVTLVGNTKMKDLGVDTLQQWEIEKILYL